MIRLVLLLLLVTYGYSATSPFHNPHFDEGRSVVVQMFEWRFDDLALECERFLGPNGYGAIQVSPPINEHTIIVSPVYNAEVKHPWYQRYQAVSYKLDNSRSGTKDQLVDMVKRCNNAGVRVYVDVILNHMSSSVSDGIQIGSAGSKYDGTNYWYEGVPYNKSHFNGPEQCDKGKKPPIVSPGAMENIEDPWQTRNCELVGLRDLDQSIDYVRQKHVDHLNELIDLGVAGFRIDASKHMYPVHMLDIFNRLHKLKIPGKSQDSLTPFIYHEAVLPFKGSPQTETVPGVSITDYTKLGRILNFEHMHTLSDILKKKGEYQLRHLKNWGKTDEEPWTNMLSPEDSVVILDNHDVQRYAEPVLPFRLGLLVKMAHVLMLSWPYGVAKVMSSYDWPRQVVMAEDVNAWYGPPHEKDWQTSRVRVNYAGQCIRGWICEHRWPVIATMVKFRAAVGDAPVSNFWSSPDKEQIAYARDGKGFVAINNDQDEMDVELQTSLPEGSYCDLINLEKRPHLFSKCRGTVIKVGSDGVAHITIPPTDGSRVPIIAFTVHNKID